MPDLCALADVKAYLPSFTTAAETDDALIARLITSESDEWIEVTGREVKPESTNSATRAFDVTSAIAARRRLPIGDAATVTAIAQKRAGSSVQSFNVAGPDAILLPRTRKSFEPYTRIWFPTISTSPALLLEEDTVEVTAVWGWPSVPTPVKEAVVALAAAAYLSDASRDSGVDDVAPEIAVALRRNVRRALDLRQRMSIP